MATEFKLPELGENIESGDLVRLMIKPGASINEGDAVMELETDKAVVEVPSSVTGTVGEIRVKEGDKLKVGQVIFTIENGAGAAASPVAKAEKAPAQTKTAAVVEAQVADTSAPATPASPAPVAAPQVDRRAKPAAAAPS
jgi:pyruvate dehydrogenase E2 component (dihydrolipoamide acetyltransferase)